MNGISSDNHPFEMPILARRLGGMTQYVAVLRTARAAASRSGGPLSFAKAHAAVPAGCRPNNCAAEDTPPHRRTAKNIVPPAQSG